MDSIANKTQAKAFAAELGWTQADGARAFNDADFPLDRIEALNRMVQFAGPELLNRQRLQGAQKAQVTKNRNQVERLELELVATIDTYEDKLTRDRSQFIAVIKTVYGLLRTFGYRDQWVEALIQTYDDHLNGEESNPSEQNAA
jgi:tRNA U34 5-carboxymethylaminomethyl modifying GTPase MnmE/TrmE